MECPNCEEELNEVVLETIDHETKDCFYCNKCGKYYALGEIDETIIRNPFKRGDQSD